MQDYQKKYNQLKNQIKKIDFISLGSINIIYTKCGKSYCDCSKDDSKKHGPYYLWTRKINRKTVSRVLSKNQVKVCRKFIKNNKKLKEIIEKMRRISEKVIEDS